MEDLGIFYTLAQIAISLIGFSGIVVIFGDRFKRGWTPEEVLKFYALIAPPITVLFCAFIPSILNTITEDSNLIWRIANITLGILHLANFGYFVFKLKNAVTIQKIAGITAFIMIIAHFLAAFNIIPFHETIFIIGLLQQVSVGILNFTLLFKPTVSN
jgi:hypothetical protein